MILKLRTSTNNGGTWRYIDRIRDAQTYEPLTDAHEKPATVTAVGFTSYHQLVDAVNFTWGDGSDREFDEEIWPDLPCESGENTVGPYVSVVVLHTNDNRAIFALIADEAFLLSDQGDTVDRLR